MRELLEFAVWLVPLWVSFKYRLLFFDAAPGSALAVVSVIWGLYVIWGTAIAQKVKGCHTDWSTGTPIAILVSALIPVLVARYVRPAVGATCAFIVAAQYFRTELPTTCQAATAWAGICVGGATLIVQETSSLRWLIQRILWAT